MENEIGNFIKIWITVLVSICYCYVVGRVVSKGIQRLFCLLPIVFLFLCLPLFLSTINLGGTTVLFIAWLANLKLLLFVFGKGPLSSDPSLPLARFVAEACLPIKSQQNPSPQSHLDAQSQGKKSFLNYAVKGLLLAMWMHVHEYRNFIHPKIIYFFYCLLIYIELEIVLAFAATLAWVLLGLELEQSFDEPYLSTSLQDFWGRRWNLMVPSILRPAVYEPTRNLASLFVGRKWALVPAVLGTFLVSGAMHALFSYYMGCERSAIWKLTCFFLLHGVCLTTEIALKKKFGGRWQLPRLVSGPLTMGFVLFTGFQLFLPSMHKCQAFERVCMEFSVLFEFAVNASRFIGIILIHTPSQDGTI